MISYVHSAKDVGHEQLEGFFHQWPQPPSTRTHLRILQASAAVILAVDDKTDRVVGFVTAISDGILAAYIPLLEVLPDYRGRGIGSELIRRMLSELEGLYMVDLVCDVELRQFYERFGLKAMTAMTQRDFAVQSGRL